MINRILNFARKQNKILTSKTTFMNQSYEIAPTLDN